MNIRKFENLHILLWLLKDLFWVTLSEVAGVIMIVPAVGLAIYITWLARDIKAELFHNLAVCCWIIANSVWMVGEFFYDDSTRMITGILFITGLSFITWYYVRYAVPEALKKN
jgi:hypothetical protein